MKQVSLSVNMIKAVKVACLLGVMLMSLSAQAQCHERDSVKGFEIFSDPEQLPTFRGGYAALSEFLESHINYPPEAIKDSIQGRVVVQFVVDSLGYVGNVEVVRSVDERLDREAIRVCKLLPRFSPGRLYGRAVNMDYTLPVIFKLQDSIEPTKPKDVIVNAEYPGGEKALAQFLKSNIKYPSRAVKKMVEGKVTVNFIVDENGKVCDVNVAEGVNKDLNREALRVCRLLPDFIPATVNGELVKVLFSLPIRFKIPGIKHQSLKTVQIDAK